MESRDEYKSSRPSPEEHQAEQKRTLNKLTLDMFLFRKEVDDGNDSPQRIVAEELKKERTENFLKSLHEEGIDPSIYQLYYVLTNEEPISGAEYEFDVPNPIDKYGPGLIQQFIEKNFSRKNKV
jgi:hypothetical protein